MEGVCSRPLSTGFNSDGAHSQRSISDAELAKRFIQLEKCCFIVNCFSSRKIVKMKESWRGARAETAEAAGERCKCKLGQHGQSRRHTHIHRHIHRYMDSQKCCQRRNFSLPSASVPVQSTNQPPACLQACLLPTSEYPMSCN